MVASCSTRIDLQNIQSLGFAEPKAFDEPKTARTVIQFTDDQGPVRARFYASDAKKWWFVPWIPKIKRKEGWRPGCWNKKR